MSALLETLMPLAKATKPIDHKLFERIPYFATVFSEKAIWPVLAKLSGKGGIAHIEMKTFRPGAKIITKGQFDQMIYWILQGHANVMVEINGQPKVVHKSTAGECIGELGVIRGATRTTDVMAGEKGVTVIEVDWAITEKHHELGKYFFHLLTMHLADKLDKAYAKQIKLIANAINIVNEKTASLIEKNRKLMIIIKKHGLDCAINEDIEQEQVLSHAIANIRESLELLRVQENQNNLEKLGLV